MEPFDTFMEFYDKIVPNIYTPEPGIMEVLLNFVNYYLSRICDQYSIYVTIFSFTTLTGNRQVHGVKLSSSLFAKIVVRYGHF